MNSRGNHKILRLFRSRIARAMQVIGMKKRCASRPDHRCLSLNGDGESAADHQQEFFMLVPMGRMRRASRCKCRLVNFKVAARMSHAIQD